LQLPKERSGKLVASFLIDSQKGDAKKGSLDGRRLGAGIKLAAQHSVPIEKGPQ
jgi:hypothetical protein